ncbi:MAG: hypothetical protein ACJATF_003647 [Flavobacteriales bacterium]|jgi:hypothetical protein
MLRLKYRANYNSIIAFEIYLGGLPRILTFDLSYGGILDLCSSSSLCFLFLKNMFLRLLREL